MFIVRSTDIGLIVDSAQCSELFQVPPFADRSVSGVANVIRARTYFFPSVTVCHDVLDPCVTPDRRMFRVTLMTVLSRVLRIWRPF